jgi:hypothetical protein
MIDSKKRSILKTIRKHLIKHCERDAKEVLGKKQQS